MKKILPVIFILVLFNYRAEAGLPGLTGSHSGRHLMTTEGQPFFMMGRQINYTWGNFWQLYEQKIDGNEKTTQRKSIIEV